MYYIGNIMCDPDYLEHHGILGMKWGVRRYQNEDGSLTAAGKARYATQNNSTDQKVASFGKKAVRTSAVTAIGAQAAVGAAQGYLNEAKRLFSTGRRLRDWKQARKYVETANKVVDVATVLDKVSKVSLGIALGSAAFVTGRNLARTIVAKNAERTAKKADSFEKNRFIYTEDSNVQGTYGDFKKYGKLVDKKLKAADRAKRWGVS